MQAMKSSGKCLLEGNVEVDELVVGGQKEGVRGRKNDKKKLVVVAIEKKGKGVFMTCAKVITAGSSKNFKPFFEANISK